MAQTKQIRVSPEAFDRLAALAGGAQPRSVGLLLETLSYADHGVLTQAAIRRGASEACAAAAAPAQEAP